MHQDMNIYASVLREGESIGFINTVLMEGEANADGTDAPGNRERDIEIRATRECHVVVLEMETERVETRVGPMCAVAPRTHTESPHSMHATP
jgi:hypothetical protein